MVAMKWERLLSDRRFFWPRDLPEHSRPHNDTVIGVFQTDSSRVTNSTAYHRLQRKTQVLPYPKTDYPRTRLTHTNEVSDCGRELARMVGQRLEGEGKVSAKQVAAMEDIVAAASKAHDLGNPPFGHSGEHAIRDWAGRNVLKAGNQRFSEVSEGMREELANFDGNGQGFRIITETSGWRHQGGLQLTTAVLASFCKYPWTSQISRKSGSKYSIPFHSEAAAKFIFDDVGMISLNDSKSPLKYARHPLAYIVEAADDISYITSDLEDAARAEVKRGDEIIEYLDNISHSVIGDGGEDFIRRRDQIICDSKGKLRYSKDHAQRALKAAAADAFVDHYDAIMNGSGVKSLLDVSLAGSIVRDAKKYMREHIYDSVDKVRHEVFGCRVVQNLLDFYTDALFLLRDQVNSGRTFEVGDKMVDEVLRRYVITFPLDNYVCTIEEARQHETVTDLMRRCKADDLVRMVLDFVSGMTDQYAVTIYKQIFGIERPDATW